jgi:hypothetical protein
MPLTQKCLHPDRPVFEPDAALGGVQGISSSAITRALSLPALSASEPGDSPARDLGMPQVQDSASPRLLPFPRSLESAIKTTDRVERPGEMRSKSWHSAPVRHAASVALATSGPLPCRVPSACQFPRHHRPGLLEASAHFTRVLGLDWQGCAGPEGALWFRSDPCISATTVANAEGPVCLSVAQTLTRLRE